MEKRIILAILLMAGLVFLGIYYATNSIPNKALNQSMPWDSYVDNNNKTVAFGLKLKEDTLAQAMQYFGTEAEVALFEDDGGKYSLEVFLAGSRSAALGAQVVLTLITNKEDIEYLLKNIQDTQRMPSKSFKHNFTQQTQNNFLTKVVNSISFIPKVNLEKSVIRERFGEPKRIQVINKKLEKWHYPKKGLTIAVNKDNKEVLEYE